MIPRVHLLLTLVAVVIAIVMSAAAYPLLPDPAPIHWNIRGEVDGYGPRWVLAVLTPAIMVFMTGLLAVLPLLGPLRSNMESFRTTYGLVCVLLNVFFAVLHGVILGAALGWVSDIGALLCAAIGLMVAALGNLFGKLRRNLYVGIRTPWTIMNDEVWERTHRLGGRLWFVIGLCLAVAGFVLPGWICFILLMTGLLGSTLLVVVYSAVIYHKLGARDDAIESGPARSSSE